MSDFETIRAEREGNVLTITLYRPERLNACPPAMADEIFTAIRDLGDARIARRHDKPVAFRVLHHRPGEGMFPPATAEDQDVHGGILLLGLPVPAF